MNVQFDTDNAEWELARRCVEQTGCNLFLTGRAGTGKTTFLRALRESTAKRVVVAAPTGVAAINAGGVTLHSFFQLPLGVLLPGAESENERRYTFSKEKRAIVEGLDLLVIDEISMVRADVLDAVDAVLRRLRNDESPFGGVQLLLIGDLRQLPPVAKDDEWEILRQAYETPYFFGSRALARAPYRCIELQHVYRQQDAGFLDLLNAVRDGNPGPAVLDALNRRVLRQPPTATPAPDDGIVLCTHNAQAQSLNEERLRALPGTARRYDAEVKGTFPETSWPTEGGLDLKVGSQVMFLKNDPDKRFYNGRIGRVTRLCDGGRVAVRCDGDAADIEVGPMSWENLRYSTDPESGQLKQEVAGTFSQLPLKLSWAITVHKSQGLTFDRVRLLADRSFAPGQVYVALSRCRTLEGLALERPLPASAIQVDPAIDRYVREIESRRVTEDTLREDRLLYRNRVLANVFRFRDLGRAAYRLRRTADTDAPSLAPGVARALQDLYEVVSLDIEDVGRRFVRHLENALASWFDADSLPPALAERLGKAAAYYLPILEEKVLAALERLDLATDNRAVAHALRRDASALAAAARVKIAAMRSLEDGFSVEGLLRDMAAARFDAAGSAAAPGKRGRRGKTADAADTSVAGATVAPEGLEGAEELVRALRAFRQGVAREKHWPPYMVFSQKALYGIASRLPLDAVALEQVPGMSRARAEKYADGILPLVRAHVAATGDTGTSAAPGLFG